MSNTEERLKKIITELLGVEEVITNDMRVSDFNIDSLDAIEMILTIEEVFDCEIHDDDLSYDMSIQQIIDYVDVRK